MGCVFGGGIAGDGFQLPFSLEKWLKKSLTPYWNRLNSGSFEKILSLLLIGLENWAILEGFHQTKVVAKGKRLLGRGGQRQGKTLGVDREFKTVS
jgi:hypothetical protein